MHFKRISRINSRMDYELACYLRGYCPTSKEIENSEVREMADRLKAVSDKETLANVLEWQERNFVFWSERWPLSNLFSMLLIIGLFSLYVLLFLNSQILWWVTVISAISAVTVFSVIVVLLKLIRKIPVWNGLKNTFAPSISINFFLKNKLGVCRDYAKLTACLLSNIYPYAEVYFAHAPQHVATGIMIENKLYMLDKQLPAVTIDKWHQRWHKHRYSEKTMEKVKGNCMETVDINSFLSKTRSTKLDTEKLTKEMTQLLNIKEETADANLSSLEIPRWKKGAVLYEDNEIVNYSLSQGLKAKIASEMVELSQITKLEIMQEKNDLTFRISFKSNK